MLPQKPQKKSIWLIAGCAVLVCILMACSNSSIASNNQTVKEDGVTPDQTFRPTATKAPQLGQITFALKTTENGDPIEPDYVFDAGVTQVHAIFEYNNMLPDYTWTQVLYYNGDELLSTSQPWTEAETGLFDYLIDAGGQPLSAGEWALELYVEDELLAGGSFIIEYSDGD